MPQFQYAAHGSATQETELIEVVLDRVDGVKDPATGLQFILHKSEGAQLRADLERFAGQSKHALELLKAAALPLDAELAAALNAVAAQLGLGEPFAPASPDASPAVTEVAASADPAEEEEAAASAAEPEAEAVAASVADEASAAPAVELDALIDQKLEEKLAPVGERLASVFEAVKELQAQVTKAKARPTAPSGRPVAAPPPKPVPQLATIEDVSWSNIVFPDR